MNDMKAFLKRKIGLKNKYRIRYFLHVLGIPNPFLSSETVILNAKYAFNFRLRKRIPIYPNLIVIGAYRSGTSSLHHYLKLHPEIFMSNPIKETLHYFSFLTQKKFFRERNLPLLSERHLKKSYLLKGYHAEKYIGDVSPQYSMGITNEILMIPKNIRHLVPYAKIIYLVRDPLIRIRSAYWMALRKDSKYKDCKLFWNSDYAPLESSLYYKQISKYRNCFSNDQILVMEYDAFFSNIPFSLFRIFDFLGLERIKLPETFPVINYSQEHFMADKPNIVCERFFFNSIMSELKNDSKRLSESFHLDLDHWFTDQEGWVVKDQSSENSRSMLR
jgi:hypothetical protein